MADEVVAGASSALKSGSKKRKARPESSGSKKRKTSSKKSSTSAPSSLRAYKSVRANELPWKKPKGVRYDFDGFEGGDGGMLELEEIDDVDVEWEELASGGKQLKFKVRENQLESKADSDEDSLAGEQFELDGEDADDDAGEEEEWTGFGAEDGQEAEEKDSPAAGSEPLEQPEADEVAGPVASTSKAAPPPPAPRTDIDYEAPFDDTLLPEFSHISLLPSLKRAIHSLKFSKPSEIQDSTLSQVLTASDAPVTRRDVVGIAETGSGKTLAYSLPILQEILSTSAKEEGRRALSALILCPTRELALQVRQHVGDIIYRASIPPEELGDYKGESEESTKGPKQKAKQKKGKTDNTEEAEGEAKDQKRTKHIPRVNIITICGGMSVQKQKRLLSSPHGVDIIVATPGRLWDMLEEDPELGKQIKGTKFLVLDEADRMIESGHFAELENIVGLTRRTPVDSSKAEEFVNDFDNPSASLEAFPTRQDIMTYVFSATMSKELQKNVKKKGGRKGGKFALAEEEKGKLGALGDLLHKIDFRDEDPLIIDLTPDGGTVKKIQEIKVDCLLTEKDVYLYYFLLRYPGRTLVFLSAIDGIRRLQPLLALLQLPISVLHSGMQQRARLKSLDRFKSGASTVLLATDVAARGLDIPTVEHVVHYQLPRTADTYVHRSGRTARMGNEGIALQLCAPEEKPTQKALMKSLNKTAPLQELSVEFSLLKRLSERVELARKIEVASHKANKASHEENWLQQAAKEMEIDLDSDDSDGGRSAVKRQNKNAKFEEKSLKLKLEGLLKQPLMLRGLSAKYITSGTAGFADQMLKGANHKVMLGLPQSRAVEDFR